MANTEHALIAIDPASEIQNITINLENGTLWATPNGGALRATQKTLVHWQCVYPFTVTFQQLGGAATPWGPLASTPVGREQVVQAKVPSVPVAAAQAPFYKYTVQVGSLVLDPIIIVDKT